MRLLRQAGFTLIELLVALVILGLLVGLVGPQFFGKVDSSKVKTSKIQVDMLKVSLQTYRLDGWGYPDTPGGAMGASGNSEQAIGVDHISMVQCPLTHGNSLISMDWIRRRPMVSTYTVLAVMGSTVVPV